MIKRMTVEGRAATVAYVTNDFKPASPDDADLVEIVFDTGEVRIGIKSEPDKRKMLWQREKARAQALLKD